MYKVISLAAALVFSQAVLLAQTPTTVAVDTTTKAQTVTGFGAAVGYFENWLPPHPNKADIYKLMFSDLDLGILRLRNSFGYPNATTADVKEIVEQAGVSLGRPIDILMSCWSAPAALKMNGVTTGGTLLNKNGQFVYTDFAQWWFDSIQWYSQAGVVPTYISMQNEPDFETTGWDTSVFKPTESTAFPSYGAALKALSTKIQTMTAGRPKIWGPEVTGVGFNNFQNYANALDRTLLDGYAYHLYNGGDANNPDSYNTNLSPLKTTYNDKPNIMTEFSGGNWFNTALLIQNCLLNANASGYLYWDLIWGRPYGTGGLISVENPWDKTTWTSPSGYIINPEYYALKHYSKSISKGSVRVQSSTVNTNVRPVTFLNSSGDKLIAVVLNTGNASEAATFSFAGFSAASVVGYQSVENSYYISLGAMAPGDAISLPARSVTTLEFIKGVPVNVPATGVSIVPATASVGVGASATLSAKVAPGNATNKAVTWTSSNPAVATVNASGVVTGVSVGSATITVKTVDGGFTATSAIDVSVIVVPVTGITVSPTSGTLSLGGTLTLTAAVAPGNATNKTITWTSSSPAIATVSATGVVTGVAPGSVTITATTQNGGFKASAMLTVANGGLPCVNPVSTALPLMQNGVGEFCWVTSGTIDFVNSWNAQLVEINGVPFTNKWANALPPRVNGNYYIHYISNVGWAHFEANGSGGGGGNPTVSVTGVTLTPTTLSLATSATAALTATVAPATATNKAVTWTSSNPAVATVNTSGVVTGVAAGSATITVKTQDGGFTATCAATVTNTTIPVTGVTVSPPSISVAAGSTSALTATVSPANATTKTVTWTSSSPTIATVSASGVVTGVAPGSATITAKTQDGSFTGSTAVTVTSSSIPVTGVSVTPTTATVAAGSTTSLLATILPANATVKTVTWASSAPAIATVSATGVVTGVSAGNATITATTVNGGFTASAVVTVTAGNGGSTTPCTAPTTITLPFAQNGAGDFCFVTSGNINFINSWNMQLVEVNGVAFTNRWANSLPPRINGNYYVHYVATLPWAHLEINGTP